MKQVNRDKEFEDVCREGNLCPVGDISYESPVDSMRHDLFLVPSKGVSHEPPAGSTHREKR
jgi:hypothetical protein